MNDQTYTPYRQVLLDKKELARLSELKFTKPAIDTIFLWLQIISAWLIAAHTTPLWVDFLCACYVGNRYYSLFIIGHDGLHRRIHPNQKINDLWTDLLLIGPLGAIVRINRHNHIKHHRSLNSPLDPDYYKYKSRKNLGPLKFWLSITGLTFLYRSIKNVYGNKTESKAKPDNKYKKRDFLILLSIQSVLLITLTNLFGWWGYFGMWLAPIYIFTYAADMTRVFCEHSTQSGADDTTLGQRLIMFDSYWPERIIFAPMNMNHHIAHHLWPSIPYYRLPEATTLLINKLNALPSSTSKMEFRDGFLSYLQKYTRNKESITQKTPA
jgi:fatty acid desaturase